MTKMVTKMHLSGACSKTPGQAVLCLAVIPRSEHQKGSNASLDRLLEFPLYWISNFQDKESGNEEAIALSLAEILADPLLEELWCAFPDERHNWGSCWKEEGFSFFAERQYLPGVTDNLGRTVEEALQLSGFAEGIRVASGTGFLINHKSKTLKQKKDIEEYCRYRHYHPVTDRFLVHDLEDTGSSTDYLSFPQVHLPLPPPVKVVSLDLDDEGLEALSKSRILALNLEEMKAIKDYFSLADVKGKRQSKGLSQWPTDVELEVIAQTWSEHCKHKIFNATIHHTEKLSSGESKQSIKSLYKTYIQDPTKQLSSQRKDLLSVFKDNAGVIKWNDQWAVCFKVETHNSPSALEPYGGALTGILGVNRDILGTGLGAKPILNTDIFCFAYPDKDLPHRPTMLPAESIIQGVRRGVQDGGNKSGIPTVNGAVYFHPGYRAKPLVFCGTAGILPLEIEGRAAYEKHTEIKDTVVMAGGRVGKDGIHGATFSSEALHEGSPISAVQIGDPFTQKRLLDFVIEARDAGLITGITDNGAGGLSSSVGEMATLTGGATLTLDNVPLKYPGLADYEIVISESQERMTISTRHMDELKKLADKHRVEITDVGKFNNQGYFEVLRHGKTIAWLDLEFLHDGVPHMVLNSVWEPTLLVESKKPEDSDLAGTLMQLLSRPNICSREEIIRQYDHEVQGGSVIKPLMGPSQQGPCDAAVIRPLYGENAGLVIANGLCPQLSQYDCHLMAVCAVDEAVRNAVCVGADPESLSLLDNFCWTDPVQSPKNIEGSKKLGQLVRACQGLQEAVLAYKAPLISGKDSMKNDFDDGTIRLSVPPTLLISAMGRLPDSDLAVSMEFKQAGDEIYLLSAGRLGLAGSEYASLKGWTSNLLPALDLQAALKLYKTVHKGILKGLLRSCHDLSEGGLGVAIAECIIGSHLGCTLSLQSIIESAACTAAGKTGDQAAKSSTSTKSPGKGKTGHSGQSPQREKPDLEWIKRADCAFFAEGPGRILVSVCPEWKDEWEAASSDLASIRIGTVQSDRRLEIKDSHGKTTVSLSAKELSQSWNTRLPLD